MLYLAIPAHNEVATIGVLLWRLRTVLAEFPREYEVVVYDDASTDETAAVAEQYESAMPVTVLRGTTHVGYAGAVDALSRYVAQHTRYPRRDAMLLLQADFTDPPGIVPEFARRFEGGADLVVGERASVADAPVAVRRLFRAVQWALRPFVSVQGITDLTASMRLVRISALRESLRIAGDAPVVGGDSWTANADLLARLVPHARRVESVRVEPTYGVRMRETRRVAMRDALAAAGWGWKNRGRKIVPSSAPETAEAPARTGRPERSDRPERGDRQERNPRRKQDSEVSLEKLREKVQHLDRPRGDVAEEPRNGRRDPRRGRDAARETPRETPRETQRETPRESPREASRETPREGVRENVDAARPPRPPRKPREAARSPYADAETLDDPFAAPTTRTNGERPSSRGVAASDAATPVVPPRAPSADSGRDDDDGVIIDATDIIAGDMPGDPSVSGAEDAVEGDESTDARERKRRRNRRSRRRRSRRVNEDGEVEASGEAGEADDSDSSDADDAPSANSASGDGDENGESDDVFASDDPAERRGRRRRKRGGRDRNKKRNAEGGGEAVVGEGGEESERAPSVGGNVADRDDDSADDSADGSDDGGDDGGNGEHGEAGDDGDDSPRARRRGRRGRRGGARRSRGRQREDGTDGGGTDTGGGAFGGDAGGAGDSGAGPVND